MLETNAQPLGYGVCCVWCGVWRKTSMHTTLQCIVVLAVFVGGRSQEQQQQHYQQPWWHHHELQYTHFLGTIWWLKVEGFERWPCWAQPHELQLGVLVA